MSKPSELEQEYVYTVYEKRDIKCYKHALSRYKKNKILVKPKLYEGNVYSRICLLVLSYCHKMDQNRLIV